MTDSSKTRFECRSLLIYAVLNTVLNDNGGGGRKGEETFILFELQY